MADRRTYTEELVELKLAVAPVPEIQDDVKELVRAIKGNNGNVGLVARVAQVEKTVGDQCNDLSDFKRQYYVELKETRSFINQRFDQMFAEIQKMNKERIERLEEEEDAREEDERASRKDLRNFWIGLGLGLIPQMVEYLLSIF